MLFSAGRRFYGEGNYSGLGVQAIKITPTPIHPAGRGAGFNAAINSFYTG